METEDRKRIRCKCGLVQFVNVKRVCVRCHQPFEAKPIVVAVSEAAEQVAVPPTKGKTARPGFEYWSGIAFAFLRCRQNLSQADLGKLSGRPRQHVWKIEQGVCCPTLAILEEYLPHLRASVPQFLRMTEFLMHGV